MNEVSTLQSAFNEAIIGLVKQGKPGRNPGQLMCRYRAHDGTRCGIGMLISDEHYDPKFDASGMTADSAQVQAALRESGWAVDDAGALYDLQAAVHDEAAYVFKKKKKSFVTVLLVKARKFAKKYDLQMPDLSEVSK